MFLNFERQNGIIEKEGRVEFSVRKLELFGSV